MAYKRITIMDVSEIIRRRHDGQKITHIANVLGFDRKTVRKYISKVDFHCDGADIKEQVVKLPKDIIQELQGRPAKKRKEITVKCDSKSRKKKKI